MDSASNLVRTATFRCAQHSADWMRVVLCVALLAFATQGLIAQSAPGIRVIKESAIPYTGFLSRVNFDKRFPGELKSDLSKLDNGWYVIYEHEALSYYFGPILLQSTGEDYLAQLTTTVEGAVAQRPSITGYRLELSYEPSVLSSNTPSTEPPAPSTAPPSGLWGFIKRLFGL